MRVVPVIPALEKLRQKDCEFEANVFYVVKACLNMRDRERFYKTHPNDLEGNISFYLLLVSM